MSADGAGALGRPRLHLRRTASTNDVARALAREAPHGLLVTAGEQSAGRGRQGRVWSAPPGQALLMSVVVRPPSALLSLRAGLAVADLAAAFTGAAPTVKWPNDVLLDGRKVAGVLVEGRPAEGWAVIGIGVNVAVSLSGLPLELRDRAATLGAPPERLDEALAVLLHALEARLAEPDAATLDALRALDALRDRPIAWAGGSGTGAGIAPDGGLRVRRDDGEVLVLQAGEVHLGTVFPED